MPGGGAEHKAYRNKMQEQGITLPGIPKGVPSTPNPVTHKEPGLGATTIPHPYKAGKPKI